MFNNTLPKIDFAILAAMQEELTPLNKFLNPSNKQFYRCLNYNFEIYKYKNRNILVCATGFGTAFAASLTTLIHKYFNPEYMFFTGTAGAIRQDLQLRDVIIVENSFEAEVQNTFTVLRGTPFENALIHPMKQQPLLNLFQADTKLINVANAVATKDHAALCGTVVTSNCFPAPLSLFEEVKKLNPIAIDMETSAFYQIAWLYNIRALAIRSISNILNMDGTDDHIDESDVEGSATAAVTFLMSVIDALIKPPRATIPLKRLSSTADDLVLVF